MNCFVFYCFKRAALLLSAPPFPQPPPSARQWWQCRTALGGATSPRCIWSRGRGPSDTRVQPSSTRNTPKTLTAPRSTTTPWAPAAGLSPQCSWSRARIIVPVSSTQRTCRGQTKTARTGRGRPGDHLVFPRRTRN